MGKRIKITESQYRLILDNKHLISEAEVKGETFKFTQSFPDNIAFPVKPGVNVTSIDEVGFDNMTSELHEFIRLLKIAVVSKGAIVDKVQIRSGASKATPNLDTPKGYDKKLVELSYMSDGKIKLDNNVIATNRGKAIKNIIERLIEPLKGKVLEPEIFIGSKSINITIPSGIVVIDKSKSKTKSTIANNPRFAKEYKTGKSVFNPAKDSIRVNKCGVPIAATGSAGSKTNGYLADQIMFDFDVNYSGKIDFVANSYLIPDRFVVMRSKGKSKFETINDSGYITSLKSNDKDFAPLQNELKSLVGGNLVGGKSSYKYTIEKEAGYNYKVQIFAPFGGTVWGASLKCEGEEKTPTDNVEKEDTIKPIDWYKDLPRNKDIVVYIKDGKYYTSNPDNSFNLYFKGKLNQKGYQREGIRYEYKNGKKIEHIIKDGKDTGVTGKEE